MNRIDFPTLAIAALWFVSVIILINTGTEVVDGKLIEGKNADQIPTMTFSAVAVWFAYQAYRYTKEKFRLELFEKRWEFYETFLVFMEKIEEGNGQDNQGLILDADASSFVAAYRKNSVLFDKETNQTLKEIHGIAQNVMNGNVNVRELSKVRDNLEACSVRCDTMFRNYLYFGDYKSNQEEAINLCDLCALCSLKIKNMLGSKTRKDEL